MSRSDATALRDLQAQLDNLSVGNPDPAAIAPAVEEVVAPVREKAAEIKERAQAQVHDAKERVHTQVNDAKAVIGDAADGVSVRIGEAVDRVSAVIDSTRRTADRAYGGYENVRARTGLSHGALLGIVAGSVAAVVGAAIAVPRSRASRSTLTLPGGRQIELSPAATKAATKLGKLSRRARKRAEQRIQDAADASAALAAKSRKRAQTARMRARKQLGQFSPADQLAALREAAAPLLNGPVLSANVKAGTDWLKDAAQQLRALSERLDTRPVKAQAAKAAGSTKVAAYDVAGIPVAVRDALVKAGWTPPTPKKSWTRVFGF